MSNAAKFTADLERAYQEKVILRTLSVQKKLALEALRRVVMKSPVDTGRFRGNWQVSVGVTEDGTVEVTDKSGSETINKGVRPISALSKFDTVYIQNNLPYAERLENGWSQQAPAGMVAVTVAEIEAFMNQMVDAQ